MEGKGEGMGGVAAQQSTDRCDVTWWVVNESYNDSHHTQSSTAPHSKLTIPFHASVTTSVIVVLYLIPLCVRSCLLFVYVRNSLLR